MNLLLVKYLNEQLDEHLNEQLRYWYHWQKTLVEVLILLIEVDVTNLLESTEDH